MTNKPRFVGEKVKLGELGKTQSGGTPSSKHPEFFSGSIPWIGTTALNGKLLDESNAVKMITAEAVAKSATKIVPAGSIMVGIRVGVGKVAINSVPMCTSQDIVSIIGINEEQWNKEYISLALQHKAPILASQAQGATITGITSKTLKSITIPVFPLASQNAIVLRLRSIEQQIACIKKLLNQLDSLVKSRFVEMFGDPVDDKIWPYVTLAELCTKLGSGATPRGGKSTYKTEGIPLIRSMNVHNGRFVWRDLAYIDDAQAAKLNGVTLVKGDVLLNITGASVARSCILPDELAGGRVNQHVSIVRVDQTKMLPVILNAALISDSYQRFLLNDSRMAGATREAITKEDLKNMMVPLPPLSLQQQFANFAVQVDKSRFIAQQQIEKLQMLYDSLAQDYFGD